MFTPAKEEEEVRSEVIALRQNRNVMSLKDSTQTTVCKDGKVGHECSIEKSVEKSQIEVPERVSSTLRHIPLRGMALRHQAAWRNAIKIILFRIWR
jgi:hypothetical protein